MDTRFLICEHCGNIAALIRDCGVPIKCCGESMKEITADSTDGDAQKHKPIYENKNGTVTVSVGKTPHPMTPEHYIEWICVETSDGFMYKRLCPDMPPQASFALTDNEKVIAVYAFCNKHSLWKQQ